MQREMERRRSAHAACAVCVSATPCADAVLCAQPLSSAGVWTRLRADAALIDRIHKDTIRTRRAEHFFDEVSHFGLLSLSFLLFPIHFSARLSSFFFERTPFFFLLAFKSKSILFRWKYACQLYIISFYLKQF